MIERVIDTEGPIHEDVLVRRIAQHHGFQQVGQPIHEVVCNLARRRRPRKREQVGVFFWPKGITKVSQVPARYLERDEEMRNVDYLCVEEIQAIDRVLGRKGDVIELAHRLGISHLSQAARARLEAALADSSSVSSSTT
jgi:Protein of unknown function (DUF3320).